jgi:hypothetical protein
MKSQTLKIIQLAALSTLLMILGASCNGGSGSKWVHVTNPEPTPTGPIHVCPVWGCNGPEPTQNGPFGPQPEPTVCPAWGCGGPPSGGVYSYSVDSDTRDTDLQQANLQNTTLASRAQMISDQFQMSVEAATQLAVLGDKVQMMTVQGKDLSDEDRAAVTQSALSIAGITSDDVNQALQHAVAGDNTATDALIEKAAQNLGMPSSDNLRNQLLPALGIQLQ